MVKIKNGSNKNMIIAVGIIIVISLVAISHLKRAYNSEITKMKTESPVIVSADFFCEGGKSISATFVNGSQNRVELNLSDGRKVNLDQTISADGARYANWDKSFVFWNKGNTAFVQEGSATAYTDCVEKDSKSAPN